ncbi:hypothetical protein BJV78DRAFT_1157541 [Lactifluus subvellereus]|nr:hypothetical protein BJV78DRAFT_1157541 [Lactifluus subvellereus]
MVLGIPRQSFQGAIQGYAARRRVLHFKNWICSEVVSGEEKDSEEDSKLLHNEQLGDEHATTMRSNHALINQVGRRSRELDRGQVRKTSRPAGHLTYGVLLKAYDPGARRFRTRSIEKTKLLVLSSARGSSGFPIDFHNSFAPTGKKRSGNLEHSRTF